jgi:NADH-quinone oxidoreductase subunit C
VTEALRVLREEPSLRFDVLSDLTAVHWPDREKPFEVVYQLYSIPYRTRYRLKVPLGEGEKIPTSTGLWRSADWMEREVFDLFGIPFEGHPDLRRILNPEDFDGHPLRKDFPLLGKAER